MTDHYLKIRTKLGLADKKEEVDDILEYPVPIEDQFPQVVRNKFKSKIKEHTKLSKKHVIKANKEIKPATSQAIKRETKYLTNNLSGVQSQSLVDNNDVKFVRNTDPSVGYTTLSGKPAMLRRLYQPPLKHHEIPSNNPFCTKSFTLERSFIQKSKRGSTNRVLSRSVRKFDESDYSQIDWTKVSPRLIDL